MSTLPAACKGDLPKRTNHELQLLPELGDQRLKENQNLKGSTPLSDFQYTYNPVGTIATWAQQQDSSTPTSYANDRPAAIECIVLTHNDADHAGAIASIVKDHGSRIGGIRMLVDRGQDDAVFRKVFREAKEGHDRGLYTLERLELGVVLWSDPDTQSSLAVMHPSFVENIEASNPNNASAVLVLVSGGNALVAWPGDLEIRHTAHVLGANPPELLFGPHHGGPSDYPSRSVRRKNRSLSVSVKAEVKAAVTALHPKHSFISVGTGNKYSHPRPGFVRLLVRQRTRVHCSQLTRLCDRNHIRHNKHVFQGAGVLGLRPARKGVSCRGAMSYFVKDGLLVPDRYEQAHLARIEQLLRPQCLSKI